jgi:predicted  nucleic acid-binding Zn-ribbon protein
MYDQLDSLLELQNIDGEIDKFESQKASEPAKLKAFENELLKYTQKLDTKTQEIEEINKRRRDWDRKLAVQQAQLDKYKAQRTSIKTNKEYTALELEISELEKTNSEVEEEIIKLMLELDSAKDELETVKKDYQAQEAIFQKRKKEIIAKIKALNKQIALLTEKRNPYLSKISSPLMNKYNDWRKKKGGSLVALIVGQNCAGCHLKLPPQLINEVRKKRDLLACNSCGRILYWKEEVIVVEPQGEKKNND